MTNLAHDGFPARLSPGRYAAQCGAEQIPSSALSPASGPRSAPHPPVETNEKGAKGK